MPDIERKVENSPAPATYTIGSMIAAERNGYTGLDNVKVHLSNISGKMRHRYSSRSEAERLWRLALSRTRHCSCGSARRQGRGCLRSWRSGGGT